MIDYDVKEKGANTSLILFDDGAFHVQTSNGESLMQIEHPDAAACMELTESEELTP